MLTADAPDKAHVTYHDRDTPGMDGTQVDFIEEVDEVSLSSLLQSLKCMGVEADVTNSADVTILA
jgi:hypothetical protein